IGREQQHSVAIHLNHRPRPRVERRLERIGIFGASQRSRLKKPPRPSVDELVLFVSLRVLRGKVALEHLSRRRWKFLFPRDANFPDQHIITHAVPTISCGSELAPNCRVNKVSSTGRTLLWPGWMKFWPGCLTWPMRWRIVFFLSLLLLASGAAWAQSGDSGQVEGLLRRGAQAMQAGHPAEAEAAFRRATVVAPDAAPAWLDLGLAELKQGKVADAIADIGKSLALDPSSHGAHLFLGI